MKRERPSRLALLLCLLLGGRSLAQPLHPVLIAEPAAQKTTATTLPLLRVLPDSDPRAIEAHKLLDNEAARFVRRLLSVAWRISGRPSVSPLPIVLKPGGNHANMGHRLDRAGTITAHPDEPHVLLELKPSRMSHTMLHEGGHAAEIVLRGSRRARNPPWTATIHSTFTVTDPLTAMAEGFATHLETLWGQFGADRERRAYYFRHSPDFGNPPDLEADYFFPVRDPLTLAQNWSRYQGVRDETPAFAAAPRGDYLRVQYDPARDLAELKTGNGMLASEGVVASVLYWIVAGPALEKGCAPGGGLEQPGLLAAEEPLLAALHAMPGSTEPYRPDLVDLMEAFGPDGSALRRHAVSRFVDVTRGVTADPQVRSRWRELYTASLALDSRKVQLAATALSQARSRVLTGAASLRDGLGPVLPVRLEGVTVTMPALGETFPAELDLNAADEAFVSLLPLARRQGLSGELHRAPFASLAEAEKRLGFPLQQLGLTPVQ